MEVVKLIQPHEFGDNFILEVGKWKVNFPPIARSGVEDLIYDVGPDMVMRKQLLGNWQKKYK